MHKPGLNLMLIALLCVIFSGVITVKAQTNPHDDLLVVCAFSFFGWEEAFETAEKELNRVTPAITIRNYEATAEQTCDIQVIIHGSPNVCEWAKVFAIGCFDPRYNTIHLINDPPSRTTLLLHELAHALGNFGHPCHEGIISILSCEYDPERTFFTEWDMQVFADYGWPMTEELQQ